MKHLLIILISILLLSSFITSCDKKEKILYRWETPSGDVWKGFGDKETHPTYEGEVLVLSGIFGDYVKEGLGSMTYPNGDKYVGEWKNSKMNGQGTFTYSNGWKFVGEWKDDKKWNITFYLKNGTIHEKWLDGNPIKP